MAISDGKHGLNFIVRFVGKLTWVLGIELNLIVEIKGKRKIMDFLFSSEILENI